MSRDSKNSHFSRKAALKAGLCIWCRKIPHETDRTRCSICILKDRERKRKAQHSRQWQPGFKGRPPEI